MANTESIKLYLSGDLSDDDLAKEYYNYIKGVASVVASRYMYDADDLTQELWGLFVSKIVHTYDSSRSLDGYVYEFAKRHCLYLKGMNREISFSQFSKGDADEDDEGGFWLKNENEILANFDEEEIHSKVKGQRLVSKTLLDINILRKIPCISDELESPTGSLEDIVKVMIYSGISKELDADVVLEVSKELHKLRNDSQKEKSVKEKIEIPADHRELREIRIKMGMTKPQFAKSIEVHITSLDAYEYGKTKTVPKSVMDTARLLASNFTDEFFEVKQIFANMQMSQIVHRWAGMASIDVDDFDKLAVLLGTTRTTIRRWLSNESRAEISKLSALEKIVKERSEGTFTREIAIESS